MLEYFPWIQGMWGKAPDHFKTQKICCKAVKKGSWALKSVLDHLKTQKVCDAAAWEDPFTVQFIPHWFVTQQQLKTWDDYHGLCNNDRLIKWYSGYQKCKTQKAK